MCELIGEYALREAEWKGKDAILSLVMDEDFSARDFLDGAEELRQSIEEAGLRRRSEMNLGPLRLISTRMEDEEGESRRIRGSSKAFVPGESTPSGRTTTRGSFKNAAYRWAEEQLAGMTAENSDDVPPVLESERELAEKIFAHIRGP